MGKPPGSESRPRFSCKLHFIHFLCITFTFLCLTVSSRSLSFHSRTLTHFGESVEQDLPAHNVQSDLALNFPLLYHLSIKETLYHTNEPIESGLFNS